jgi:hypothetical protein
MNSFLFICNTKSTTQHVTKLLFIYPRQNFLIERSKLLNQLLNKQRTKDREEMRRREERERDVDHFSHVLHPDNICKMSSIVYTSTHMSRISFLSQFSPSMWEECVWWISFLIVVQISVDVWENRIWCVCVCVWERERERERLWSRINESEWEKERIQDVDWDLSSNTFPSVLGSAEDNRLESSVSTLGLCEWICVSMCASVPHSSITKMFYHFTKDWLQRYLYAFSHLLTE